MYNVSMQIYYVIQLSTKQIVFQSLDFEAATSICTAGNSTEMGHDFGLFSVDLREVR
jgi:hypothetical protein